MSDELITIIATMLTLIGVSTLNEMFPSHNRPFIFQGKCGEPFFMGISGGFFIFPISLLYWSFKFIDWYIVIFLIIGAIAATDFFLRRFRRLFFSTIFPPLLSLVGLIILNFIAWR